MRYPLFARGTLYSNSGEVIPQPRVADHIRLVTEYGVQKRAELATAGTPPPTASLASSRASNFPAPAHENISPPAAQPRRDAVCRAASRLPRACPGRATAAPLPDAGRYWAREDRFHAGVARHTARVVENFVPRLFEEFFDHRVGCAGRGRRLASKSAQPRSTALMAIFYRAFSA